ncbi:MAG TPA: SBBP repeat-containing protein [Polyangiaceae bacterium]
MKLRVLSPFAFALCVHCVGDSSVPAPDGGNDATTDAGLDSATDATQDVGDEADAAVPLTGAFGSVLVLPASTLAWSAMTFGSNGDVLLGGALSDVSGPALINGTTFTSKGGNDMLVMKLAPNDGFKWTVDYGGANDDRVNGVAMDAAGNAYVVGSVDCQTASGAVAFDVSHSIACSHTGLLSVVAKLNAADGTIAWLETFDTASSGTNFCFAAAFDASNGDVTVGCNMLGNISFVDTGSTTRTVTHALNAAGDIFLAELDPATGHVAKSAYLSGSASDSVAKLAYDSAGNLYVVGTTSSSTLAAYIPATSGSSSFTLSPPASSSAGFVIDLKGSDWSLLWDKAYGASAKNTSFTSASVDTANDLYAAGQFNGTVDFGLGGVTAAGSVDGMVVKVTSAGVTSGVAQFGAANVNMIGTRVAVDATGDVAVAGYYDAVAAGIKIGGTQLPDSNGHAYAAYTAKFSSDLKTAIWAQGNSCPTANAPATGIAMSEVAIDPLTQGVVTFGTLDGPATTDFGDGKQVTRSGSAIFFLRRAP